jgi:hypothetical protein
MPVNCEFCGSPSLHGAKLCAACRSALKRARHDPVSVLDALQKSKSAMRRRSRQKEAIAALPPAGTPPPRRRGPAPAVVGGIAAILCLLIYGLLQHLDGSARAGLPAQAGANAPVEVAPQSNPAMATPMTNPEPSGTDGSEPPATEPPQSMPDSVEPLPVEPPRAVVPRPRRKAPPAPAAPPVVVIAPTIPEPAPVAPPPPPRPAPPPSRETLLATAFAACTSPDALEKAICQQRARVDLCEGYWGLVPQCPARRESGS